MDVLTERLFADLLAKHWQDLYAAAGDDSTMVVWRRLTDELKASLPSAALAAQLTVDKLRTKLGNERRAIKDKRLVDLVGSWELLLEV